MTLSHNSSTQGSSQTTQPPIAQKRISELILDFESGKLSSLELGQRILTASIPSDGSLTIDANRQQRCGFPEVIFGTGKTADVISAGIETLLQYHAEVLVTRVIPEQVRVLSERFPYHRWNHRGNTFRVGSNQVPAAPEDCEKVSDCGNASDPTETRPARVAIVSAGTTDEAIALEAQETLAWMGHRSVLIQDVGVAGPYRLLARVPELQSMSVIVCVAGMEGALPSVLGGYVSCPIIAIPTSVGYGANFGGVSALLSMLNACAANVSVVNIDSGFKGGYMAGLIASQRNIH